MKKAIGTIKTERGISKLGYNTENGAIVGTFGNGDFEELEETAESYDEAVEIVLAVYSLREWELELA